MPFRDELLYRAIVDRAEGDLLKGFPKWARFGRTDEARDESSSQAESGWFRAWLARQNHHWVMSGKYPWLVETDVANFFPYVDVNSVVQSVLSHSDLSEDVVRLLYFMLKSYSPMKNYRTSRAGGLPQEPLDSSRILAHAYLRGVDDALQPEGDEERYTRWVDDILIGAATHDEALQQVRRVQLALENLGLYPNSSKTRILRAAEFTDEYLKSENDYIGELEEELSSGGRILNLRQFHGRLHDHLLQRPRRKAWTRVLRRYYGLSRAVGDTYLMRWWARHLTDAPDSAAQVFEYLATFRLTEARLRALASSMDGFGGVYEDIELLAREYTLMAPNQASDALRATVAGWAQDAVTANYLTNPRLAASAVLVVGKFGTKVVLDALERDFRRRMVTDSVVRQQTAIILFATDRVTTDELLLMAIGSSSEALSQVRFLQAIVSGDRTAIGIAIGLAQPIERKRPVRAVIRPRALFLMPLIARGDPGRWRAVGLRWLAKLRANPPRLRDAASERWIEASL